MITCPSCQHQNESDASFCNQCGYPLQASNATKAESPAPANPSQSFASDLVRPFEQTSTQSPGDIPVESQINQTSTQSPGDIPVESQIVQGVSIPSNRQGGMPVAILAIAGVSAVAVIVAGALFLNRLTQPEPEVAESPISEGSAGSPTLSAGSPTPSPSGDPSVAPTSRVVLPPPSSASALAENQDLKTANSKVWRVIDDGGLNCRSGPGVDNAVKKTFPPGKELPVNAKYDNPIQYDPKGKPWLAVGQPGLDCFVRANESLIVAVPNRAASNSDTVSKDNCPGDTLYTFFAETKGFYINLCEAVDESDLYYVGSAKNGSGEIVLKIDDFDENGYYASNGNVKYFLDLLNDKLVVTQSGKTLLDEGFITSAVIE